MMINKNIIMFNSFFVFFILFSFVVMAQNNEPYLGPKLEICMESQNNCQEWETDSIIDP